MTPTRLALIMAFASTGAFAQSQINTATIRAVATNKTGLVRGLSAKDFKVSVDKKDRPVTAAAIRPAGKHAILLLFDKTTFSAQDQADIRGYVANFITAAANPNLYMAIAAFNVGTEILQPYTTDAARLKAALAGTAAAAIANTVGGGASARTATTLGATATGQTSLGDTQAGGDSVMKAQAFLESLRGVLESMTPIRGAKAVILFSGGQAFSTDAMPQVEAALAAANKAGVTIYGVSDNTAFSKTFADPTGGSAIKITQYLADALKLITQELDSAYDVSVSLADAGPAAGCHALRVETAADGVDVRAPKTFCPATEKDALAGTEIGKNLDGWLSGQSAGKLAASTRAFWRHKGNDANGSVIVAVDAPAPGIKFQKVKDKFHGEISVAGAAYRADGALAARFSETVALDFNDKKQVDAFAKRAFHYENQLELPPGKYAIKVALSPASDAWGKADTSVEIAPRNAAALDMSGVALSTELRPLAGGAVSGLDPAMLEGAAPLEAANRQITPSGESRFKKSDKVYMYAEIHDPALARGEPALYLQYRIVDRSSGEERASSGAAPASLAGFVRPGTPLVPFATAVPTAQLAPGAYRLDVRVLHPNGTEDVIRSTEFEVVQ
jgi:VWFA-related protein